MMVAVVLSVTMSACTPHSVREAEKVVTQADSLWQAGKMYGVDAGDSVSLAQAYETLQEHSAFSRQFSEVCPFVPCTSFLRTYSHACYHYGKLLRAKGNPVAAMQVFIAATHSHTRDYHILGRVYSNMGDICHLAGECPLSYDMFERSADMFLRNGDTLLYYYGLNNMAFELAEQGKKEETLTLLSDIESQCTDNDVLAKVWETKANVYERAEKYDSVLVMMEKISSSATSYVFKARAYEHLGQIDSALYYAHKVMSLFDASEQNKYNMIYIILNYDSTLRNEDIIALSAQRSDIETDILIPLHNRWAMAVQLLEQDLNRKKDRRWLYVLTAFILFAGSFIILYYIWHKRKEHQQIMAELQAKEEVHAQLEQTISDLSQLQDTQHHQILEEIETVCELLHNSSDIKTELCWSNYTQMCAIVNRRIYNIADRLNSFSLSEKEIRLCILVLLHSSTKQMVDMIPYSQSGLGKFKNTTARKLGTTTANLRSFLLNLAY